MRNLRETTDRARAGGGRLRRADGTRAADLADAAQHAGRRRGGHLGSGRGHRGAEAQLPVPRLLPGSRLLRSRLGVARGLPGGRAGRATTARRCASGSTPTCCSSAGPTGARAAHRRRPAAPRLDDGRLRPLPARQPARRRRLRRRRRGRGVVPAVGESRPARARLPAGAVPAPGDADRRDADERSGARAARRGDGRWSGVALALFVRNDALAAGGQP